MEFDLNCDLGEGCPFDAELMPHINSANIACGAHAGDAATMWATLQWAKLHGVRVGAHPGFPDKEHFGRRELTWPAERIFTECVAQIGALSALARATGLELQYVKPHGALYNMSCRDPAVARPVVNAAAQFSLPVMGLPNSMLQSEAIQQGLTFIKEGFADRRYEADGSLVPRSQARAMIDDPEEAAQQVHWLCKQKSVESVCVHGDRPGVVSFTKRLRELLDAS